LSYEKRELNSATPTLGLTNSAVGALAAHHLPTRSKPQRRTTTRL
jgi:hypothetical protein